MSTYSDKLKDPRWQKKRLEMLNAADWKCSQCGAWTQQMHVHHRYYLANRDPWDYPDWAYAVLCDPHHAEAHKNEEEGETMAWEKMVEMVMSDIWIPLGHNLECDMCHKVLSDLNSNASKMGRHRFICIQCEKRLEDEDRQKGGDAP